MYRLGVRCQANCLSIDSLAASDALVESGSVNSPEQKLAVFLHRMLRHRRLTLFPQAVEPADVLLFQEVAETGIAIWHVCRVVSVLLANPEARQERSDAAHGCDDGGDR